MCEMMNPYTSRSVWLAFKVSLKGKYERKNQKIENEDQMIRPNPNVILQREAGSAQNIEKRNVQVEV